VSTQRDPDEQRVERLVLQLLDRRQLSEASKSREKQPFEQDARKLIAAAAAQQYRLVRKDGALHTGQTLFRNLSGYK